MDIFAQSLARRLMKLGKIIAKNDSALDFQPLSSLFQNAGLTTDFIEKVMRPLWAGIFLDPELHTYVKAFRHILSYFIKGKGGLPKQGIEAIPKTIERKFKRTKIHFQTKVVGLQDRNLLLESGESVAADRIILALSLNAASAFIPSLNQRKDLSTTCCYFAIEEGFFIPSPFIYLTEDKNGPINHFSVLNLIQSSYAPVGKYLFSTSILNPRWQTEPDIEKVVAEWLGLYFNVSASRFEHLKTYHIAHALPEQTSPPPFDGQYCYDQERGIYLCGELVDFPSFNDSVLSGRHAAEAVQRSCVS
jgi:hypothetical protein